MPFRSVATFEVARAGLSWPWIALAAGGEHIAFASSAETLATRSLAGDGVVAGPSFALPRDLTLHPKVEGPREGLHAFSVDRSASQAAVAGIVDGSAVVAVLDAGGERARIRLDAVVGDAHVVHAIAFDRTGRRVWVSAEGPTETVVVLLDVTTLASVGVARSPAFPRPALHEIHVHPQDDAILLLAACGDDGTFARVVGFAGDELASIPTALDSGNVAAGFVGFSVDGARVHLAEADELRTHGWPTLDELSSVTFPDDFVSGFSGAVIGKDILVDGQLADDGDDAVARFDATALRGFVERPPVPTGMWAGRLGAFVVTVDAKGDPAPARVYAYTSDARRAMS